MNENILGNKNITITLGDGREYVIKPLPLDDIIEVWPIIEKLQNAEKEVSKEMLIDIKRLAYVVLKANNSNVLEETIGKIVDLADMQKIIPIIVGQKS